MTTKEEFVIAYAKRSGVTVQDLWDIGKRAVPAERDSSCDDPECEGWHMIWKGIWEEDVRYGVRDVKDLELLD